MNNEPKDKEAQENLEPTGEDNVDEPELEDVEATGQSKIKQLQAKLKACEAEKAAHLDDLQRVKADFLNARRRLEEEKEREKERAITDHIKKLLPLCDSFYMAMSNTEVWEAVDPEWRKGVESINDQLQKILQSYGVTEINPLGEEFDPNQHEAVSEVPVTDETQNNSVVEVIQNGYVRTTADTSELVRPARVSVGVLQA